MLFYFQAGANTADITPKDHYHLPCKYLSCGAMQVKAHLLQEYGVLIHIPFYPLVKKYITVCYACKQVCEADAIPAAYGQLTDALASKKVKAPWWMYMWPMMLVFFSLLIWYVVAQNDRVETKTIAVHTKYLAAPQKGDTYIVKEKSNNYSPWHVIYQVRSFSGDSIDYYCHSFMYTYDMDAENAVKRIVLPESEDVPLFSDSFVVRYPASFFLKNAKYVESIYTSRKR